MHAKKICLASDNWSGVHPSIIQAIIDANEGYAPAYGSDLWTERACTTIQEAFKVKCKVFIVPTGTGANIFGLKLACLRFESVICTDIAHIQYQESGAAESIIGCKLVIVPHQNGKINPKSIWKKLKIERAFGKHSTSPRVLSISQPTEVGTVYKLEELIALSKLCHEENLYLHIDGSRLYNAIVNLKVFFDEMIEAAKPDVLSLGGTKNGLMGAEALVIFNPKLEQGSDHQHKQTLQLMSKMRFLSAQYIPFIKDNLWHSLAKHANQKAQQIAEIIQSIPQLSLSYPVETNQIFFTAPSSWISLIQEEIACHLWDHEKNEIRFIASWSTSDEDVASVKTILTKIQKRSI